MSKKKYSGLTCAPYHFDLENIILAGSTIVNSMVSSVGQEIGTEETFVEGDFVNTNWDTGTN